MDIDTTIFIKDGLLTKLEIAAVQMGLSRNKVIIMLMRRVSDKKELEINMFFRVSNQLRDGEPGRRMHVWLPPQVYETWHDLRKFNKMSVSAIIAYAIREYLDILLMQSTLTEDPLFADNYRDKYFFAARDSGGLQKFVIVWGFPETKELEKYFPQE